MKTLRWILIFAFTSGCSERVVVRTDADPDIDLLIFETYGWPLPTEAEKKANPLLYNEFSNRHIRSAIDEQMKRRGYQLTDSLPELTIHYHFLVKEKRLFIYDNTVNETYSPSWYPREHFTYHYEEGSFIIDIIESKTGHILWRGWAEQIIESYPFSLSEKEINRTVENIFEKYLAHPRTVVKK